MSGLDTDRIHIVDSRTVSFSITLLVQEAFELRKQGKSAKEMAEILEEDAKKVRYMGIVPTLEYLKRGGRISAAKAAIGDLVGIKPLLAVVDGVVEVPMKVRGLKKAYNSLPRLAKEWGIDLDRPVLFGYTGLDPQPAHTLKEAFDKQL
ncbi:DegV, partial [gut metagenome]